MMDDARFAVPGEEGASERWMSRALKLSPDMVACIDPALHLIYANPRLAEITGLTLAQHPANPMEGG